jgi:hypothetical protein
MDGVTVVTKASPVAVDGAFVKDNILPIASFMGLDTHNISDSDKSAMQQIYDFIRGDAKEMTELELLHKVREMEQKLGMTSLGERRVDKLSRYVKLQGQIDNLTKARDSELR